MKKCLENHSVLNVCCEAQRLQRWKAAVIAGEGSVHLAVSSTVRGRVAVLLHVLLGGGEGEGPLVETRALQQRIERWASKAGVSVRQH